MKIEESTVSLSASHVSQRSESRDIRSTLGFRQVLGEVEASDPAPARGEEERRRVTRLLQSLIDALIAAMDQQAAKPCRAENLAGDALPAAAETPHTQTVAVWSSSAEICVSESETTQVCAQGQVRTADGRQIDFSLNLNRHRESVSRQHWQSSGEVVLRDPLVVDFAGTGAELDGARFDFDLDADGQVESLPGLGRGAGFLVFDRNGNGRADDGSELFGTASGNGFADLAALDSDGNGWVDEGDPAFAQLRVWNGDRFATLAERDIGALYASAVDAPFSLKSADNDLLGEMRRAGVYLRENGRAGSLQQIDLATAPASVAVSPSAPAEDQPEQRQQLAA